MSLEHMVGRSAVTTSARRRRQGRGIDIVRLLLLSVVYRRTVISYASVARATRSVPWSRVWKIATPFPRGLSRAPREHIVLMRRTGYLIHAIEKSGIRDGRKYSGEICPTGDRPVPRVTGKSRPGRPLGRHLLSGSVTWQELMCVCVCGKKPRKLDDTAGQAWRPRNSSEGVEMARHGYAIDRACPYRRETRKLSPCASVAIPAWLRRRRVGVPRSTPAVLAAGNG